MLTDFAAIWWLVCNLTSHCWRRIALKSDVVYQSYGNVYRVQFFRGHGVNIKKQQFICSVNGSGSKTTKIIKRWYYSASLWHLDDVFVGNMIFLWFLLFLICCHWHCGYTVVFHIYFYYRRWSSECSMSQDMDPHRISVVWVLNVLDCHKYLTKIRL